MNLVRFSRFQRLLSCFLAEFFPFRSSRVLMSLLLKAVGLKSFGGKFPHSSPLLFPQLWYLGLYGLKIPILLDTWHHYVLSYYYLSEAWGQVTFTSS